MYNDLAAGVPLKDFTSPVKTVLVMDGEPRTQNFGHAREHVGMPAEPIVMPEVVVSRREGGEVSTAALRHTGGANYGYADGHAKYQKPEMVYFPPRENGSRSHRDTNGVATGPDPAGGMTFAGQQYGDVIFHVGSV
jgi:prepilin-type processing-associated H-X9-DG protein